MLTAQFSGCRLIGVLRFLVMTPVAWLNTAFREWVWKYPSRGPAVNLVRNFYLPSRRDEPYWRLQVFGCFVFWSAL